MGEVIEPDIYKCFYQVSKILLHEKINLDGSINNLRKPILSINELWSYIYYLYFYNKKVGVFKGIKEWTGQEIVKLVKKTVNINNWPTHQAKINEMLILFVNMFIIDNTKTIYNPLIVYLNKIIEKNLYLTLKPNIIIKTGNHNVVVSSSVFKK